MLRSCRRGEVGGLLRTRSAAAGEQLGTVDARPYSRTTRSDGPSMDPRACSSASAKAKAPSRVQLL